MSIKVGKLGIVRLKGPHMHALRTDVFERDNYTCQNCGAGVLWNTGHLAHIKSRGAGGSDTRENTRILCQGCHLINDHNPKSVPSKATNAN